MNIDALLNGAQLFAQSFIPFLVSSVAVAYGLFVLYTAISATAMKGQSQRAMQQEMSWGGIAAKLLIGGAMLRLGAMVDEISVLLTGAGVQDYRGVLAYAPLPAQTGLWQAVLEVCVLWVVMLGWAGVFRGFVLWSKASNGGGGGGNSGDLFWQGIWHLIGGVAAINLTGFIRSFLG